MTPAAIGIGYSLWLRMRWVVVGLLIYLAALAVTVQLFPTAMVVALVGTLAPSATVAHLLTVFTLGPADLGVRGSGFPKNMFVLPTRTRSLVGWPMLYGATTLAALWILFATLVLRPVGLQVPVLWPAALGAASTAWLQAIGWSPFPSPFVRVPVLALALTPLILLGSLAGLYLESQAVSVSIVAASLAWILAAYLFGVQGLSRARSGSEGDWLRVIVERRMARSRSQYIAAGNVLQPLRSAAAAQLWHECRRNAITFPLFLSFIGLPMLVLIVPAVIEGDASKNLMFGSAVLSPAMMGLAVMVGTLLLLCGLYGPSLGKFDIWGTEWMSSFFAIRPMATSQFVLIKFIAAAIGALMAWGIVMFLCTVWAVVEASPLNPRDSLVRAALAQASPREIVIFSVVLAGLYAQTWRALVNGMWVTLTGRKWVSVVLMILSMAIFSIAALAGVWIYKHPEVQPRLIAMVPWLIGVVLAIKLGAATWAFIALHKNRLLSPQAIKISLAGWFAAGASLLVGLSFIMTPTPLLVAGVFLMLPLSRVAVAPLALHWNRHR